MAEAGLLLNRSLDDSKVHPDKLGKPLVIGQLRFKTWASAANPTAEVLDGTGVTSLVALGTTNTTTAGTIDVPRDGVYRLRLALGQVSSASASGVMTFALQNNSAALSAPCILKLLQPAVAANFMSGVCEQVVSLVKGDSIRAVVTGTVGGVITVEEGVLTVEMLGDDLDNVTQV